jgi:hypothetical protein
VGLAGTDWIWVALAVVGDIVHWSATAVENRRYSSGARAF